MKQELIDIIVALLTPYDDKIDDAIVQSLNSALENAKLGVFFPPNN